MNVLDIIHTAETHSPAQPLPDLPEAPEYVDDERPDVTSGSKSRQPWRIEDDADAEWALTKMGEAQHEIERVRGAGEALKAPHLAFIEAVDRRVEEIIAGQARRARFLESFLLDWMSRARTRILRGKAKSRKYVAGTVGWRAAREVLVYDDEAAALEWARAQGVEAGLFRIEFKLEKDAVKAYAKKHGITPPGARWQGGDDAPFVDPTPCPPPKLPSTVTVDSLALSSEAP